MVDFLNGLHGCLLVLANEPPDIIQIPVWVDHGKEGNALVEFLGGFHAKDLFTLLIALFTLLIALAALGVGMINFLFVRRKDRMIQTYAFLNEWRDPEFYEFTRYIRDTFKKELTSRKISGGFRNLPVEEAKKLRRVTHFLDYAGRAMQTGVVDNRIILTTIGEPALQLWKILGGLVAQERELMKKEILAGGRPTKAYRQRWQGGFEHMAEEARVFQQRKAYKDSVYKGDIYEPD